MSERINCENSERTGETMQPIKCTLDCEIEVRPALFGCYYAGCPVHNNFARTMPTEEAAKKEWRRWLKIDGKVKAKGIER